MGRVYESVDDSSLSLDVSQNPTKKELMQQWVKITDHLKQTI